MLLLFGQRMRRARSVTAARRHSFEEPPEKQPSRKMWFDVADIKGGECFIQLW